MSSVRTERDDLVRATDLILRFGWNTTCYQLVNPGMSLWFSNDSEAVVGYVLRGGTRVVAGAPVCDLGRLPAVVAEFEAAAQTRVCYFGAEDRLYALLGKQPSYSTVVLGAQPVWTRHDWVRAFDTHASLRAQLHRAHNKEIEVKEWSAKEAGSSAALQAVLGDWLRTRGLPPMHFLVEPETLSRLGKRRIFVAQQGSSIVGFTVLSPIPKRGGWLTEQFVRSHNAPNGTIELLLDTAIRSVGVEGTDWVTLGIVPLSNRASVEADRNPRWLRLLSSWIRAHGRRFYDFDGLESFKEKFHPARWEPIYVIGREPRFSLATLSSIAAAFTEGPPLVAVAKGMGKAVKQELRWLLHGRN